MLIPGVGVRLPPRAPTGTAARLFPFCLGWTGQNGYFRDFQLEISGDNRIFVFMDILAILGILALDFRRYSVGGRRFGPSVTGKAGVCPARFRGGNPSDSEIAKKAPNSVRGTFFPLWKGVPYTFCLSGGFSRVCGACVGRFSASLPRPFSAQPGAGKEKKNASTGKTGNVLRSLGISGKVAGGRFAEIFLRVPPAVCGKPSTEGKGKPGFRKEARDYYSFLIISINSPNS